MFEPENPLADLCTRAAIALRTRTRNAAGMLPEVADAFATGLERTAEELQHFCAEERWESDHIKGGSIQRVVVDSDGNYRFDWFDAVNASRAVLGEQPPAWHQGAA